MSTETEFTREGRYIVVKFKDAVKYLSESERDLLERLHAKCQLGRIDEAKRQLRTVVVESDWPEYEPTWDAIEARMTGEPSEADKDKSRLDWLDNWGYEFDSPLGPIEGAWGLPLPANQKGITRNLRSAIDAAMAPNKNAPQ